MIAMLPKVYELRDFRDFTFANAVRLWGAATLPSSADVLASA